MVGVSLGGDSTIRLPSAACWGVITHTTTQPGSTGLTGQYLVSTVSIISTISIVSITQPGFTDLTGQYLISTESTVSTKSIVSIPQHSQAILILPSNI